MIKLLEMKCDTHKSNDLKKIFTFNPTQEKKHFIIQS